MMASTVKIPQGDDTMKVELTIKEAMALAGIKFHSNHDVEVSAKRKLQEALDSQYRFEERQSVH